MTDRRASRRRVLVGTGALLGLAGCTELSDSNASSTRSSPTENAPTETDTADTTTTSETDTETEEGPGYKQYHWHGRLFFEIDGTLVDFDQPKYYLDNIEDERPETVYFHFHDGAHGPNEWSNEKRIVTFQRALNLLPDIGYERRDGAHRITYDGTTYDGSRSGTDVSIHRGTERIDPTTYEVQHDDNFWISIQTETASGSGTDERSGKLIVDVNNRRLDFGADARQAGSDRFEFRDDGQPYTWYSAGDPVTLEHALATVPNVSYEQRDGSHVVSYESGGDHAGTYHETDDATQIIVRERTTPVDPTSYTLQDGDVVWVYVHTANAPDNEH
ncbi:hypothetical protein [Halorientalis sp. IM1011]|uniref:hypothetical protein n=1 Tax=Halorientalis sp. IM1011 TaxID=1932360 RepID=UPI0012F7AFB3|nr:hypothetical protein [Halorientalis sp. IM1011]